jgi:cytochrome b561
MADTLKYSPLQIGLHWLTAVLILATWWLGDGMGKALDARLEAGLSGIQGNTWHVWLGGTVFILVLLRLLVRRNHGAPKPLEKVGSWTYLAGIWGHRLLYTLMLLVPAMGALTWYGKLDPIGFPHVIAANTLMVVALGHAAVALYHHYILKDRTLRRMVRSGA